MTLEKPSDDQPQIDAEFAEIIEPINDNTAHQKARDLEDIMKQHLNEVIFNLIGGMSREEVIARLVSVLPTYLLTEYGLVPGEEVNVSCKMRSATQIATAEERESYAYEDGSLRQEYVDAWVEFMRNVYPDKEIDEDEKGLFVALNGETMIFGGIYLTDAGEGEDGVMDVKANILLSPKGTELILHVVPEDIDQFDNGLATVDDIEHHLSYHFPELYDQISDIADPDLSLEEQIDILKGLEIDYDGEAYPELGPLIGKYLTFHTNFDAHENNIEISGPYYGLSEDGSLVESNSEHYTMGAEPERLIFTSDDDGYGNIFLAVSKFSEESNNPAKHLYFIPVYSIDSMYSLRDQVKNSVSENSKMLDIYDRDALESLLDIVEEASEREAPVGEELIWYDDSDEGMTAVSPVDIQLILSSFNHLMEIINNGAAHNSDNPGSIKVDEIMQNADSILRKYTVPNLSSLQEGMELHIKNRPHRFLFKDGDSASVAELEEGERIVGEYSQPSVLAFYTDDARYTNDGSQVRINRPVIVVENAKLIGGDGIAEDLGTISVILEDDNLGGFYKHDDAIGLDYDQSGL